MPMRANLALAGLQTMPNSASAAARGGLLTALNLMLTRADLGEPRFGFSRDAEVTIASSDKRARSLHPHDKKDDTSVHDVLIMAKDSVTMAWEARWAFANTVVTSFTAGPPTEAIYEHQSLVSRFSLYLTTKAGIKKIKYAAITSYDDMMHEAGQATVALDNTAPVTAIPDTYAVGYRYLFRRTDFNGYIIRTAPCGLVKLSNSAGGTRNGSLRVPVPAYAVAGDYVEIYRSKAITPTSGTINDELYLAVEYALTSTDISNGYTVIIDRTPESDLGAELYTNSGQEGIAKANTPPPCAHTIANYNGAAWYGNTQYPYTLQVSLGGPGNFKRWDTTSSDTGDATPPYTFTVASATGVAVGQLVTTSGQNPTTAGAVFDANTFVTNVAGTTITVDKAMLSAGGAGYSVRFHDTVTLDATAYFADSTTVDAYRTFAFGADADALVVELAYIISKSSALRVANVIYSPVDQSGTLIIRSRNPGNDASFTLTSSKASEWRPALGASGLTAKRDNLFNGLAWSKYNEPEAVPLVNIVRVGREDRRILRLIPLQDALLVFKEDGIWRVTGTTPDSWTVDALDVDTALLVPQAAATLDNVAYAWTNHGIVAVDDRGAVRLSDPVIGNTMRDAQQTYKINYTASNEGIFMVAHPRRGIVALSLPAGLVLSVGDSTNAPWIVYQPGTDAFTVWTQRVEGHRCAVHDPVRDAIYAGRGGDYYEIRKERTAEASALSVRDDVHAVTIATAGSNILTFSAYDSWSPQSGDFVVQGAIRTRVTGKVGGNVFVESSAGFNPAAATATEGVNVQIDWPPQISSKTSEVALWTYGTIHLRSVSGNGVSLLPIVFGGRSEITAAADTISRSLTITGLGDFKPLRLGVPRSLVRSAKFQPRLIIYSCDCYFGLEQLALEFEPVSERVWR